MTTANTIRARVLVRGAALALFAAAGCGEFLGDLDGAHLVDGGSEDCVGAACAHHDGGLASRSSSAAGTSRGEGTSGTDGESSAQSAVTVASGTSTHGSGTGVSSSDKPEGSSQGSHTKSTTETSTAESSASTTVSSTASSSGGPDAGGSPLEWDEWLIPNDPSDVTGGAPNPESYTSNGDGTVTDNVTGLMWEQATGVDGITYPQAVSRCADLTLAGHTDWRLPTIMELVSLLDFDDETLMNATYFDTASATSLWSSTLVAGAASNAWYVDLEADTDEGDGVVQAYSLDSGMNALCVR
jgi:hypothetical protein